VFSVLMYLDVEAPPRVLSDLVLCDTEHMDEHLFLDPFATEPAPADPPAPAEPSHPVPPISEHTTRHVDIPLARDRTIEAFTEYPHLWWPLERRVTGPEGHLEFIGGELLEDGADGSEHVWASIVSVSPGVLRFNWRGRAVSEPVDRALTVRFDSNDGQDRTAVSIESDDGELVQSWSGLLEGFARFTGGAPI
ncbi:hypothetical protein M3D92_11110, partial [Micrococcus terreus]|uniref:hypothetical protein n=2 Tax=Micrococcus terreus TaxID=574650 RepID=UPI0021A2C4B5